MRCCAYGNVMWKRREVLLLSRCSLMVIAFDAFGEASQEID